MLRNGVSLIINKELNAYDQLTARRQFLGQSAKVGALAALVSTGLVPTAWGKVNTEFNIDPKAVGLTDEELQSYPVSALFASSELMDDVIYSKSFELNQNQLHHGIVEDLQIKKNTAATSGKPNQNFELSNNGNTSFLQFDATMKKIEYYAHDEAHSHEDKQGLNSRPSHGMVKETIDPSSFGYQQFANDKNQKFTAMYTSTHPESNRYNGRENKATSMASIINAIDVKIKQLQWH